MATLSHVEFYGTGGGCVLLSALVNGDAWLSTDFETAYYYDKPEEFVNYDFLENDVPYEDHFKTSSAPLPTWGEILDAVRKEIPEDYEGIKYYMRKFDLSSICTQGWEFPSEWNSKDIL